MSESVRSIELLCIGDISVDTMVSIDHLPRRDEKQWARLIGSFSGGMAANLAVAYSRLGGSVRLFARVGHDANGTLAMEALLGTKIDVSGVDEVDDPTFWTLSLIDGKGEKSMVEFLSDAIHPPWTAVGDGVDAKVAYTIGSETAAALEPFRRFQAQGIWTALDADYAEIDSESSLRELLQSTTVFFCNSDTARRLSGERTAPSAARNLNALGPQTVVITLGRNGALAVDRSDGSARVKGHKVEVVDPTGAGDCFAGAFLYARVRGWPLRASLELANLAAAISTTAYGCQTASPTRESILAMPDIPFRALLDS
jgi:ribokinase